MKNLLTPDAYVSSIYKITPGGLRNNGIHGLILDVDNTLVATYTKHADKKIIDYIAELKAQGIKSIVVSNARKERVESFCKPFDIEYVHKALKPFRRGFELALDKLNLPKEQLAIVGDQLFTDVLGGKLFGIKAILIKPIDSNEPFFIKMKRIFEKPFLLNKHFTDSY